MDYDAALADYQQAFKVDPDYPGMSILIERAEQHKRDILQGQIVMGLFGIGMLAMLYAAFRAYRSPTAFSHSIDRRFVRAADGKLIFHPPPRGPGYVVPDADKEHALRVFARHWMAVGLALPVALLAAPVGLALLVIPHLSLSQKWGASSGWLPLIYGWTMGSMVMGGIFAGLWRRAAMQGMVKSGLKQKRPLSNRWVSDFIRDVPVGARCWFMVMLAVYVFLESVAGIWRHDTNCRPQELPECRHWSG
ncbi:MAG TPA: hypothetical protein VMU41_04410 [Candidatus Binataceae bacterium]|nr:hypothetical protein [Candidatus Binataceae bacterium]